MTTPVELVETRTTDDIILAGALVAGAGNAGGPRPFDAVLMMHGIGSTFYDPFFREFSTALVARGYATLRANNRGHDIVSRGNRSGHLAGAAFERLAECVHDWRAWIDLLAERGYPRVLVWGHSLGAVKSAWYLSHERDERVGGAILASPPRFDTALFAASPRSSEFADHVARAQGLVAAGTPEALFRTTFPVPSLASATAYLEKYASGRAHDVFRFVADIPCPVLALTGERELGDVNFSTHPAEYAIARQRKPDIEHVVVPGGDHFYSAAQPFVSETVAAWLERF